MKKNEDLPKGLQEVDELIDKHEHIMADGTKIIHSHAHTHERTTAVIHRMSRLIGHLEATKRMIENGRDCSEVLLQLSAVDAAIKAVSKVILKDHMQHCIFEAVKENDNDAIEELTRTIEQFIR